MERTSMRRAGRARKGPRFSHAEQAAIKLARTDEEGLLGLVRHFYESCLPPLEGLKGVGDLEEFSNRLSRLDWWIGVFAEENRKRAGKGCPPFMVRMVYPDDTNRNHFTGGWAYSLEEAEDVAKKLRWTYGTGLTRYTEIIRFHSDGRPPEVVSTTYLRPRKTSDPGRLPKRSTRPDSPLTTSPPVN
jgi:hypothetical protein